MNSSDIGPVKQTTKKDKNIFDSVNIFFLSFNNNLNIVLLTFFLNIKEYKVSTITSIMPAVIDKALSIK